MPHSDRDSVWLAGVAEFDITPPPGVDLIGYGNRPGPANHVLDPLAVRALALTPEGGSPVVLTGADLLGLGPESIRRIRAALADVVPPERLLLNHSHTHAGPTTVTLRAMGQADEAYVHMVERWTAGAVRLALRNARPARLAFGTAESSIGLNRRELRAGRIILGENPSGRYDPTVSVLRIVDAATGRPLACWFSHATHPVVMGPANTGISAEWPGAAVAALRATLGCPAVFAQGCCGDINPVRRGEHAVARSVGNELAGSALIAWERALPLDLSARGSQAVLETVALPLHRPTEAEARTALAQAEENLAAFHAARGDEPLSEEQSRRMVVPSLVGWARRYLAAAGGEGPDTVGMDVQALRLGDLQIVATAAEAFVAYSDAIRERSRTEHSVALGYSNGCFGYLPTADAFPNRGYEVDTAFKYYGTCMVTPECESLTLQALERCSEALES